MDQGIGYQVGILELDNSFPQSLGLFDWGELGRALKNVLAGLRNSLLEFATSMLVQQLSGLVPSLAQ